MDSEEEVDSEVVEDSEEDSEAEDFEEAHLVVEVIMVDQVGDRLEERVPLE